MGGWGVIRRRCAFERVECARFRLIPLAGQGRCLWLKPVHVIPSASIFTADYPRIRLVRSFDELISTPMENGVNALCWRRELPGDFNEIANALHVCDGITTLDDSILQQLSLSDAGKIARDILLRDQQVLRARDLSPNLDCIRVAPRDLRGGPIATDVYSWHADSATVPADTWLCSYNLVSSEGLPNEDAIRKVDIPEIRAALLAGFGGEDNDAFRDFLTENYYDLHYAPLPHARPFSFGLGNLWRIATDYPESPVPPCIHRAPITTAGQPPRLLLIS
jgi:hypothetical protein